MGKVSLEISSNISKLLGETTQLNENIKKLTTETDNYTKRSTDGFYKETLSVKQLNTEIKTQEKIIKDMERELEKMSKLQGKRAQESQKDYKRLHGDVKIAHDELKRLQAQQASMTSQGSAMFKNLGAAIMAAFTVTAAFKFGKAIMNSTHEGSEALRMFTEGFGQSMAYLNRAIYNVDFDHLIKGLKDAYEEGKRYAEMLDTLENRKRGLTLQLLQIDTLLIEQRTLLKTRFIYDENGKIIREDVEIRKKASDEIKRLLELKLIMTKKYAEEALANEVTNTKQISGLQEEQILDFIRNFRNYMALAEGDMAKVEQDWETRIKKGADVNSYVLKTVALNTKYISTSFGVTEVQLKSYDDVVSGLTDTQKENLDIWGKSNKIIDEQRIKLQQAMIAVDTADKEYAAGKESITRQLNMLLGETMRIEGETAKAVEKANDIKLDSWYDYLNTLQKWIHDLSEEDAEIDIDFNIPKPTNEANEAWLKSYEDIAKYAQDAFDTTTEGQKRALDKQLAALEENHKLGLISEENYAAAIAAINKKIDASRSWAEDNPFWSSLGLTSDKEVSMITDNFNKVIDSVNQLLDAEINASDQTIDMYNNRIDEIQTSLDRELELKLEGLANDYEGQKEQLLKVQALRDAELKEKAKYVEEQRILNGVMQLASLVTAAAEVLASEADKGVMGIALALIAIAGIITGFLTFQSEAEAATAYETGGLLKGKKHSEGGIRIPGTNIEVEGDEYVTNRGSTQKYLPLLEAINKDDRDGMKIFFDRKFVNKMPQQKVSFDIDSSKKLGEIVRELKKGKAEITYGNGFIIERIGGYTKKINLN